MHGTVLLLLVSSSLSTASSPRTASSLISAAEQLVEEIAESSSNLVLVPTVVHNVLYQRPQSAPIGTLFVAHGCSHSATDWWPRSAACPTCLGLPEEVAIVRSALMRGYVVIAMSSTDRDSKCWSAKRDGPSVARVLTTETWAAARPLLAFGASSGGSFVGYLAPHVRAAGGTLAAIAVQIAALPTSFIERSTSPKGSATHSRGARFPAAVFLPMERDVRTLYAARACVKLLRSKARPATLLELSPHRITNDWFSSRIETMPKELATALVRILIDAKLVDAETRILADDPRRPQPSRRGGATTTWRRAIADANSVVATRIERSGDTLVADASPIAEVLNVAYGMHELSSSRFDEALTWMTKHAAGGAAAADADANPTRVRREVIHDGLGPAVRRGKTYRAMVTLWVEDQSSGALTPSGWSTRRGEGGNDEPFEFSPGVNLIQGWTEGVLMMVEGERAKLHVPPGKAYGAQAQGRQGGAWYIPPNAALCFDIEILGATTS
jgi:hypothetical protein